jgi:hypothetical protein
MLSIAIHYVADDGSEHYGIDLGNLEKYQIYRSHYPRNIKTQDGEHAPSAVFPILLILPSTDKATVD